MIPFDQISYFYLPIVDYSLGLSPSACEKFSTVMLPLMAIVGKAKSATVCGDEGIYFFTCSYVWEIP